LFRFDTVDLDAAGALKNFDDMVAEEPGYLWRNIAIIGRPRRRHVDEQSSKNAKGGKSHGGLRWGRSAIIADGKLLGEQEPVIRLPSRWN
jgi:hypothetical protein